MSLKGKIVLVTGASRGIGRGIARGLGEAGATVYVTGRTVQLGNEAVPGTIQSVAAEVDAAGGKGIAVRCDHSVDAEISALFKRIADESGRLDVLVNNAYSGLGETADHFAKLFWQTEPEYWDIINQVGLRSHYIASVHAARMMVAQRSGLIINVSSLGGLAYLFSTPYGVGKAAMDRMAKDMAAELRPLGVAVVSLWPTFVETEFTTKVLAEARPAVRRMLQTFSETPLLTGRVVAAIVADRRVMRKTGKPILTSDVARRHRLRGEDGTRPRSVRNLSALARSVLPGPLTAVAYLVPPIRVPLGILAKLLPRHSLTLKGKGYRQT